MGTQSVDKCSRSFYLGMSVCGNQFRYNPMSRGIPNMKSSVVGGCIAAVMASAAFAQAPEVKTAEQVYKNIQQLKTIPADQLMATMQFMSASLGMECSSC